MLLGSFKETLYQHDNLFVEILFVKKVIMMLIKVDKMTPWFIFLFLLKDFFTYLFFIFISATIGSFDDGIGANINFFNNNYNNNNIM